MTAKPKPKSTIELLLSVFQDYPGSQLVDYLKDGACLQGTVDGEVFGLEKSDGILLISRGRPESPDITVEMNRDACEYLAR